MKIIGILYMVTFMPSTFPGHLPPFFISVYLHAIYLSRSPPTILHLWLPSCHLPSPVTSHHSSSMVTFMPSTFPGHLPPFFIYGYLHAIYLPRSPPTILHLWPPSCCSLSLVTFLSLKTWFSDVAVSPWQQSFQVATLSS